MSSKYKQVSNVRFGNCRASIGTNENEPRLSPIAYEVRSRKMAPLVRIIPRELPFLTRVFEVFDANYAPEKTGSSGPESLFEVNGRSRKSKSRCSSVQKRSVVWKSPPDSGTVDSDWYILCFNLAQFNLHSSWHVLGCVNFVLGSPDVIVICIPHVYHMRESIVRVYQRETPAREHSKCIRTVRKVEQLLFCSANLSFRTCVCVMYVAWFNYIYTITL